MALLRASLCDECILPSVTDQCGMCQLCLRSMQIFFPLAPGIESIWEPFQEEVQEKYDEVQRQISDVVDGMQHAWLLHCLTSCEVQICCLLFSVCLLGSGYGLHSNTMSAHVDTKDMADQWKQEIEEIEQQIKASSGDVRVYFKGKLQRLLRRQKDKS